MLERFDLALFDFRNCGRNPFHAAESHHYLRFARDSATVHGAIAEQWGEKTTVGVFHSMSAIAALLAVVEGVRHWDALVLFDAPKTAPCCKLFCETFGIDYAFVPDTSHLLQLEEPERCFALFEGFLADSGIAT